VAHRMRVPGGGHPAFRCSSRRHARWLPRIQIPRGSWLPCAGSAVPGECAARRWPSPASGRASSRTWRLRVGGGARRGHPAFRCATRRHARGLPRIQVPRRLWPARVRSTAGGARPARSGLRGARWRSRGRARRAEDIPRSAAMRGDALAGFRGIKFREGAGSLAPGRRFLATARRVRGPRRRVVARARVLGACASAVGPAVDTQRSAAKRCDALAGFRGFKFRGEPGLLASGRRLVARARARSDLRGARWRLCGTRVARGGHPAICRDARRHARWLPRNQVSRGSWLACAGSKAGGARSRVVAPARRAVASGESASGESASGESARGLRSRPTTGPPTAPRDRVPISCRPRAAPRERGPPARNSRAGLTGFP
jgi:hypothetical protein